METIGCQLWHSLWGKLEKKYMKLPYLGMKIRGKNKANKMALKKQHVLLRLR